MGAIQVPYRPIGLVKTILVKHSRYLRVIRKRIFMIPVLYTFRPISSTLCITLGLSIMGLDLIIFIQLRTMGLRINTRR